MQRTHLPSSPVNELEQIARPPQRLHVRAQLGERPPEVHQRGRVQREVGEEVVQQDLLHVRRQRWDRETSGSGNVRLPYHLRLADLGLLSTRTTNIASHLRATDGLY